LSSESRAVSIRHGGLLARLVAQLAADLQPVHAGQVEVEHDGIEFMHHGQVQASHAVGGEVHGMPAILQVVPEVGGDVAVVFDDQDSHAVFLAGAGVAM
jgi:hypothetical protein